MSQEFGRIKTEVKDKAWIEQEGMGLFLAVSRASHLPPQFIICSYQGHAVSSDHTVLVGKGITYDTGGLKLKALDNMVLMRSDMTGAAVCLGVIQSLAALGVPVNVTAVIPTCENAINERAFKNGDVYKSRSGITVEVTNTDAEGRLILADALSYAVDTLNPNRIIDVGTLTGSMEIALGNELMGLFSNSDSLAQELFQAGQRTHELAWRMPLYPEYKDQLKSDIADIKNAATPKGGSILCAIFIEQFVKNIPWAHFDMASVAFAKEARAYWPKNATGIGVRLLVDYFEHLSKRVDV
jgi:leucyl aminopeptidase